MGECLSCPDGVDCNIAHVSVDEVVCPYCGHAYGDSSEDYAEQDRVTCEKCGKEFTLQIEHIYAYTTFRKTIKKDRKINDNQ